MFQKEVIGYDVRVHVLAEKAFAVRIDSNAVDYRYYHRQGTYASRRKMALPDDIAQACVEAVRERGLTLAGIDFKVDRNGIWWCLEINPMPSFESYDVVLGGVIAKTLLSFLSRPTQENV